MACGPRSKRCSAMAYTGAWCVGGGGRGAAQRACATTGAALNVRAVAPCRTPKAGTRQDVPDHDRHERRGGIHGQDGPALRVRHEHRGRRSFVRHGGAGAHRRGGRALTAAPRRAVPRRRAWRPVAVDRGGRGPPAAARVSWRVPAELRTRARRPSCMHTAPALRAVCTPQLRSRAHRALARVSQLRAALRTSAGASAAMIVHQFPALNDNYGYLLHDEATGATATVDTPEVRGHRPLRPPQPGATHTHPRKAQRSAATAGRTRGAARCARAGR